VPYLGNTPADNFVTTIKDTFSGDDSSTQFTLSVHAQTNAIEVLVENVQQEPTVAYTVSGTTLNFDSAPPTGTDNIYVIHRDPAVARSFVSTADLADNSVTNAKLANDSVEFAEITLTADNGIIRSTGAGQMYIAADSDIFLTSQDFLFTYADFIHRGGVKLYYNNILKFETTDSGARVYGNIQGIDALPDQAGNNNKYLTTDGSVASWDSVQSGAIQDVFWENAQSLSANYTITANRSAVTAGPLTLDSGVTVTLDSNARWVIV